MPRFALLIHDSPRGLHYDFLLEVGGVLMTWGLPRQPEVGVEIECEALPDHRPLYLEYEGPISDGRGTVSRWDRGEFVAHVWNELEIVAELAGKRLAGRVELRRLPGAAGRWRFLWVA
jgi:hypothetical protein